MALKVWPSGEDREMRMFTRYTCSTKSGHILEVFKTPTGWSPCFPDYYSVYVDRGDGLGQWVGDYSPNDKELVDKFVEDFNRYMDWVKPFTSKKDE